MKTAVYVYILQIGNHTCPFVNYPFNTIRRKFLTGENIDEFDEFPAIRQYFPYQNFPFSYLLTADEFKFVAIRLHPK